MNLLQISEMTEEKARKYLEEIIWPDGIVCPHCGCIDKIYPIKPSEEKKIRPGLYHCNNCAGQFTVTTKTVMHGSHLTLKQWIMAFHLMCSSKKGISALQLQRNLGLGSYTTAWYLSHRIREAMREFPLKKMLKGTVEVDETYVGGKTRKEKRGRGSERKTAVLAIVERGGNIVSKPIKKANAKTLKTAIRKTVAKSSRIITDDWPAYRGIGKEFDGGHDVIKHIYKEYIDGDIYTNTAESFFALLKRGIHGIFHHCSKKHLFRYCNEFSFRWKYKKVNDGERTEIAIKNMINKRLKFKAVIA